MSVKNFFPQFLLGNVRSICQKYRDGGKLVRVVPIVMLLTCSPYSLNSQGSSFLATSVPGREKQKYFKDLSFPFCKINHGKCGMENVGANIWIKVSP